MRFFANGKELLTKDEYDSANLGVNLIKGSELNDTTSYAWDTTQGNAKVHWDQMRLQVLGGDLIQFIPVKPNVTYSFSFCLDYLDVDSTDTGFYLVEQQSKGVNTKVYKDNQYTWNNHKIQNTAGFHSTTFTTQEDCHMLEMHIRYKGTNINGFILEKVKLEEGSAATAWTPNPEDAEMIGIWEQINALKSKVGGVAQSANPLALKFYATSVKEVA